MNVRRVAVFGNAGGGKSTLARRLAELTGLPLHVIDMMKYRPGGAEVPHEQYLREHAALIATEAWIIDGYGCVPSAWARFEAADTLVHVDLPIAVHYWRVTKRLAKGLLADPPGWPPGSPVWSSSLSSYRVIGPCDRHLTPKYRALVREASATKRAHALRSPGEVREFLREVARERAADRRDGDGAVAGGERR